MQIQEAGRWQRAASTTRMLWPDLWAVQDKLALAEQDHKQHALWLTCEHCRSYTECGVLQVASSEGPRCCGRWHPRPCTSPRGPGALSEGGRGGVNALPGGSANLRRWCDAAGKVARGRSRGDKAPALHTPMSEGLHVDALQQVTISCRHKN